MSEEIHANDLPGRFYNNICFIKNFEEVDPDFHFGEAPASMQTAQECYDEMCEILNGKPMTDEFISYLEKT